METGFQSGFVTLIGMPNAGKSTLINLLVGESISVSTPKAHTTREKTLGIMTTIGFQLIFCDTPGLLNPKHALQRHMKQQLQQALIAPDAIIFLLSSQEVPTDLHRRYFDKVDTSLLQLVLNKADCCTADELSMQQEKWQTFFEGHPVQPISAHTGAGLDILMSTLLERIPVHPPYYPADQLTDKSERYIAAEIMRKHVLVGYKAEVPYSTYVSISFFREVADILHIHAHLHVERESQKGILIGAGGRALRGVATRARYEMQRFFKKKIYLRTQVHVAKDWKTDQQQVNNIPTQ